ncbi:tetratricopeptide repeat protein [Nostoc sp.]|uniref:tetratricopeptide repeat protein n=1 Tax=Nostoc sp. TaxID=1180 RepID=UPI002FF7EEAE
MNFDEWWQKSLNVTIVKKGKLASVRSRSLLFCLCISTSQGQESESMANALEFFQRGREFDVKGQHQEALVEYTQAIELDPNYVEAYFYRGNALALEGQPQKGIEDLQKAAAILESRGQLEWAAAMRQQEEIIRQGIQDGEF